MQLAVFDLAGTIIEDKSGVVLQRLVNALPSSSQTKKQCHKECECSLVPAFSSNAAKFASLLL